MILNVYTIYGSIGPGREFDPNDVQIHVIKPGAGSRAQWERMETAYVLETLQRQVGFSTRTAT